MADAAEKWAAQSLYDIETAKAMLDTGRYLYVLFCCQQAVEKMQQFEDAMEELAKQSQGQGGSGIPMPWGEPSGEGDEEGESDSVRHDRVEIPDAESSRAPAEFRKELLDAMKQAPPEKYKERVKQYYEELVK